MSLILQGNNFDSPLVWMKAAIDDDVSSISCRNYWLHQTTWNFIETSFNVIMIKQLYSESHL